MYTVPWSLDTQMREACYDKYLLLEMFFIVPGFNAPIEAANILMSPFFRLQFFFPTGREQCSSGYLPVRGCPLAASWCWPGPQAAPDSRTCLGSPRGVVTTGTQDTKAFRVTVGFKDMQLTGRGCVRM